TPLIAHTYANAGNYIVSLIVTNTAGTSLFQIFTGQTVRNNGGLNALDVQTIKILLPPPVITNLNPNFGFANGGNQVTITGLNFTSATAVLFGSTQATNVTIISDTTIVATVPPGTGLINVTVITPFGTTALTPADQYTYIPVINPAPLPPTHFRGVIKENEFLTQTEYVLKLKWKASPTANVVLYRIYKNGKLIKEISAKSHLRVAFHVHSENTHKVYEISAVDVNNVESTRVKAEIMSDEQDSSSD
ncbi:MAG: IPT/TIG domain-containing protein, partial [Nostocaceae cyanobacterium]|nr:IPT/TIG domain-containing protein [Nostocaceae cyanobacterium]